MQQVKRKESPFLKAAQVIDNRDTEHSCVALILVGASRDKLEKYRSLFGFGPMCDWEIDAFCVAIQANRSRAEARDLRVWLLCMADAVLGPRGKL